MVQVRDLIKQFNLNQSEKEHVASLIANNHGKIGGIVGLIKENKKKTQEFI